MKKIQFSEAQRKAALELAKELPPGRAGGRGVRSGEGGGMPLRVPSGCP